jgi:hypothetical protein
VRDLDAFSWKDLPPNLTCRDQPANKRSVYVVEGQLYFVAYQLRLVKCALAWETTEGGSIRFEEFQLEKSGKACSRWFHQDQLKVHENVWIASLTLSIHRNDRLFTRHACNVENLNISLAHISKNLILVTLCISELATYL